MTQPPAYVRQFNFADYSASYPGVQQPGASLDAEFNAVLGSIAGARASLAVIQRDDGRLANQSVTLESLSPAVMYALGAGVIWLPRGAWVALTAYAISDVIQSGTASYVCAVAHTSGTFATDVAAGKWIKLFDDAGTIPADGSVTAIKLAAGAVTAAAIGFTSLSLSGRVRATSGLQAGTAPAEGVLHAKLDTGDVHVKVERKTDAQGAAGYQIIGVAATWAILQPLSGSTLTFARNGTVGMTLTATGGIDQAGAIRAVDGAAPTVGAGVAMTYVGGGGAHSAKITARDYDGASWTPLAIEGSTLTLVASAVTVASATATGIDFTGTVKRGGVELGYLGLPQNAQNGTYTLALTDSGKQIYSQNVAGQAIAIPTNAAVAFPVETVIVIVNDGANPITIGTTGVTVKLAGSAFTGDRTIAANGIATLVKVGTDRWFISGPGVA